MATINNGERVSAQDLANLIAVVQKPELFGLTQQEFREITAVIRNQALMIARISLNPNLQDKIDSVRPEIPTPDELASQRLEYQPGVFDGMQNIPQYEEHQKLSF